MSESPGKPKSLVGWTMVDSKGELMSEDNMSESSDSSCEIVADTATFSYSERVADVDPGVADAPFVSTVSSQDENHKTLGVAAGVDQSGVPVVPSGVLPQPPEPLEADAIHPNAMQPNMEESVVGFRLPSDISRAESDSGLGVLEADSGLDMVEKDGGLGACCKALMEEKSDGQCCSQDEFHGHVREEVEDYVSQPSSGQPDPPCGVAVGDEGNEAAQQDNVSDSDSDFVQINEENLGEFEAEIAHNRHQGRLDRSPSIAEGFHFLGHQGAGDRGAEIAGRHVDDNVNEGNDDSANEDYNEDTESSAEDIGDDRIESDQSEVGSVNTLTDVGDLSAFADIGDVPIVAGNVARNYCHRPNNRLSTVLNVTLVVVALLTMGISIGLVMATDLEIEEWQNAYLVQNKKLSSLEWTLEDMNRVMKDSKDKVNAFESVMKSFNKAGGQNAISSKVFEDFGEIVNRFHACTKKQGSLLAIDCHVLILPEVQRSLSLLKEITEPGDRTSSNAAALKKTESKKEEQEFFRVSGPTCNPGEFEKSLNREQERALHWQNLYLMERRQREWERENDDLEDRRERAKWEKEDEEEDRRERAEWEKKDEEEDRRERAEWEKKDEEEDRRERERWEREEEENDRKERLLWEEQEKEEDKRERERWEKERADLDSLECLKRLMSTDLTVLKSHMMKLNSSTFEDFVNMSSLVSSIADLRQSVFVAVQEMWTEAEKRLKKVGEDVRNGKESYLDTSVMADYLKQALSVLQSQFEDVAKFKPDFFTKNSKEKTGGKSDNEKTGEKIGNEKTGGKRSNGKTGRKSGNEKSGGKSGNGKIGGKRGNGKTGGKSAKDETAQGNESFEKNEEKKEERPNLWNKSIGKIFKKTSKSLRKFVRTVVTSLTQAKDLWDKKAASFIGGEKKVGKDNSKPLPSWLPGKACHLLWGEGSGVLVEFESPCLWDVRDGWIQLSLDEACLPNNRYTRACNGGASFVWQVKTDFKVILEAIRKVRNVETSLIQRKNIVHLFEEFWVRWGNSKLLLEVDREWVSCQLKLWSEFANLDNSHGPIVVGVSSCDRLVHLRTVLKDIENWRVENKDKNKKSVEYFTDEDEEDEYKDESSEKEDSDSYQVEKEEDEYEDKDFKNGEKNKNDNVNFKTIESNNHSGSERYNSESLQPKLKSESDRRREERNQTETSTPASEDDDPDVMAWELKIAQNRLRRRRVQEKVTWLFDMSNHRKEMRGKQFYEGKSAQWQFDQAKDREMQRQKAMESDWQFNRARNRREEFDKKWRQQFLNDNNRARERMREMKYVTDWLVQEQGEKAPAEWRKNDRERPWAHHFDNGHGSKKQWNWRRPFS